MLVIQAILYVLVTGCAWRLLPKTYPPTQRFTIIFANGAMMGTGNVFMMLCSSRCDLLHVDIHRRVQRVSTLNRFQLP